jgi:hypothetical protein
MILNWRYYKRLQIGSIWGWEKMQRGLQKLPRLLLMGKEGTIHWRISACVLKICQYHSVLPQQAKESRKMARLQHQIFHRVIIVLARM